MFVQEEIRLKNVASSFLCFFYFCLSPLFIKVETERKFDLNCHRSWQHRGSLNDDFAGNLWYASTPWPRATCDLIFQFCEFRYAWKHFGERCRASGIPSGRALAREIVGWSYLKRNPPTCHQLEQTNCATEFRRYQNFVRERTGVAADIYTHCVKFFRTYVAMKKKTPKRKKPKRTSQISRVMFIRCSKVWTHEKRYNVEKLSKQENR